MKKEKWFFHEETSQFYSAIFCPELKRGIALLPDGDLPIRAPMAKQTRKATEEEIQKAKLALIFEKLEE